MKIKKVSLQIIINIINGVNILKNFPKILFMATPVDLVNVGKDSKLYKLKFASRELTEILKNIKIN